MADIVVGSGPSGFAVALARLSLGRQVILVDGGRDLEPAAEARRLAAAARPAESWSAAERAAWIAPQFEAPPGRPRRYGSDFATEFETLTFAAGDPVALRASRAVGGLSNLWGSAMLPWRQEDIAGWPVGTAELAPSWRALAELVPIAGEPDALADLFPALDMAGRRALPAGPQAQGLLERLARRGPALARLGARAGRARVAVAQGCRCCGLCLHGCPWGLIWSARNALDGLRADPRFDYRPGLVVRSLEEQAGGVLARLETGEALRGERLFLAAGVLETARIRMASPGGPAETVLRDSRFALMPSVQLWGNGRRPDRMPFNTLTQAFVEIDDRALSPGLIHTQIYAWNEFYGPDLRANYRRLLLFAGPALDALARRLMVAQVFLHSDQSHAFALRLGRDGRLVTELRENPAAAPAMDAALRRVAAVLRLGGLAPLRFAARTTDVGASFHVGASLPMRRDPGPQESDVLGRPGGRGRIYLVDASVLPAVPATTITFGVMGNAHRIGRTAPVG